MKKILVVGAGFAGAVIARELAEAGYYITVIDSRNHIAGNCYDYVNEYGIRVHKYGPHIWHTNNEIAHFWLSKFTKWVSYKHRVKAKLESGLYVPLPINYQSINGALNLNLKNNKEAQLFLETEKQKLNHSPKNSYEAICSKFGERLCNIFFAPYTKKMWGIELKDLDVSVAGRVSTEFQEGDPLYFPNDDLQFMPLEGYTKAFKNIFNHENIEVLIRTPFEYEMESHYYHIFNCMPIDVYFNNKFGPLPYRSLKFYTNTIRGSSGFPVPTINFTNQDNKWTRATDWKQYPACGRSDIWSTITYEEPCWYTENNNERYYPVKDSSRTNIEIYKKYKDFADATKKNMTFVGRMANYVYTDMHQAINISLSVASKFLQDEYERKNII